MKIIPATKCGLGTSTVAGSLSFKPFWSDFASTLGRSKTIIQLSARKRLQSSMPIYCGNSWQRADLARLTIAVVSTVPMLSYPTFQLRQLNR